MNFHNLLQAVKTAGLETLPVRYDLFWLPRGTGFTGPFTLSQLNKLLHQGAVAYDNHTKVYATVRPLGLLPRYSLPTGVVTIPLYFIHNLAPLFASRPVIPPPTEPPVLTVGWSWPRFLVACFIGLCLLPLGVGLFILIWSVLTKMRNKLQLYPDRVVVRQGWLTAPARTFLWSEVSRISLGPGWFGGKRFLVEVPVFPAPLIDFRGLSARQAAGLLRTARHLHYLANNYSPP